MNITEIIIGDRVLVQSAEFVKEVAQVKGVNPENGMIVVRLSDGKFSEVRPQYILKSFGR